MRMTSLIWLSSLAFLVGCAHSKMGTIQQPVQNGGLSKDTPVYISAISTSGIVFQGDKADDQARTTEEKEIIKSRYARMIADELRKRGFKTNALNGDDKKPTSGYWITGQVTRFNHGSGAARFWVGMGAGSSDMYADFKVVDLKSKKSVAEFEVIATSGGRGGLAATGSFMDAHLIDGAEKVAQYLSGEK